MRIDHRRRTLTAIAMLWALLIAGCTSDEVRGPEARQTEPPSSRESGGSGETPNFTPPSQRPVRDHPDNWFESACSLPEEHFSLIERGHREGESADLHLVPRWPNFFGSFNTTSHSGPWRYLQEVPLVFYGPGFFNPQGTISRPGTTIADIAPTLARLTRTELSNKAIGRPIDEALSGATRMPKLIVVLVWDGGGSNVLRTWPKSWPNLKRLMKSGTSISDATVGSTPSVSPAVHATIGTGAFPKQHGIVDMHIRDGQEVVKSFEDGRYLQIPTYADLHDRAYGNTPKVGMFAYHDFHAGMMGHGALLPGGDKDIQIIAPSSASIRFVAAQDYYTLPPYLYDIGGFERLKSAVDVRDGKSDGMWRGRSLDDRHDIRHSPVWVQFQTKLMKELILREGFGNDQVADLMFVNYKQIDDAGHDWNMLNVEVKDVLEQADEDLGEFVRFLDRQVGRRQWGLVLTADHGQAPDPIAARVWPIGMSTLVANLAQHFEVEESAIIDETRPTGLWLDREGLQAAGIEIEEVADFILDYRVRDDIGPDKTLPPEYESREDEPLFSAVFPTSAIGRISACIQKQSRE